MRSALSLVLAGVIALALGVFGTVALASTLDGTPSSEAAKTEQAARTGGSGSGDASGNTPLVYGTR
ncbi:hypothetical protein MRQ36_11805 [Micromonospora sp. R77]|uniref:hypothetical protein n=1 Tax=Micromonospora sp. R77 TaxID=2925836 RepID=UPI001F6039BC|nr:hypothetical protein [Micromonospora sp. R77]MCI4063222.1 hypothetical protein [Micromonospora sp. R77]